MGTEASQQNRARNYTAYGLSISSEVTLPELVPAAPVSLADLKIRRSPVDVDDLKRKGPTGYAFEQDRVRLHWETVGGFQVKGGEILADPYPGVGEELIAFPLLGPVMALALQMRGLFILHASAVVVNGAAVVLMGDKGAGKSTTASHLAAAGHPLLTDDIVAVRPTATGSFEVLPGFPQVKLSDEAKAALGEGLGKARGHVHEAIDKTRVLLSDRFCSDAMPLARCYLLRRSASANVTFLPSNDSLATLMRFSYVTRFGDAAMTGARGAVQFRQAVAIANSGVAAVLEVPTGLDRLREAVEAVENDVAVTFA